MASLGSDGATQADAGSQLSASKRDSDMTSKLQKARSFTIRLLREITDDFSDERKIGQGAYGTVYVAKLENGEDIAVKILHNNMPGNDDAQFMREFENLMRLDHENIVKLVGYCYETQHEPMQYFGRTIFTDKTYRALCFEYMENGSLQKHLSDECNGLDWNTRYNIIKGAWEGLKHLHQGFEEPIYHLDLKPDNILLDNNMLPKLADFGMSRLFNDQQTMIPHSPIGTFGYLPIEYLHENIVSNKLDIFSLGVVMIKIIGGPEAHSRSVELGHKEFLDLVHANWRNRMRNTCGSRPLEAYCEQINICTEIALTCMEFDRHKRPNIADIIHQLNDTENVIDKAWSWSASSHSRIKGDVVKLRAFTGSEGIQDADIRSNFPVLLQVTARPWPRCLEEMPCAGVDIVVVLDLFTWHYHKVSDIEIIISKLSSNDRLSLVLAGTNPRRLMELTFMSDQGRALAKPKIEEFRVPEVSNMAAGLREGAEILREREAGISNSRVGCIVLMSGVDATILAQEISPEFPVHTFGISISYASEHMKYIETLKKNMKYIVDKTSATYSFCRDKQDLNRAFEQFYFSILKVATSIKITLKAHDGVAISSIESGSNGNKVSSDKLSGEIDIRDFYAIEQKNFIVYLVVAEGKKKLLTIDGRYRSPSATSKQLPEADVFVLRPRSGCSTCSKLPMHHGVAAELARIRLLNGLSDLDRQYTMALEKLWTSLWRSMDVQGAPAREMAVLGKYVDGMREVACLPSVNPRQVPYLMSWLSCHQWQPATTKGSGAFTLAQPGNADGEDHD